MFHLTFFVIRVSSGLQFSDSGNEKGKGIGGVSAFFKSLFDDHLVTGVSDIPSLVDLLIFNKFMVVF